VVRGAGLNGTTKMNTQSVKAEMLYVGKMPEEVVDALLQSYDDQQKSGIVELNPNGEFDPEGSNSYRNVVPYYIEEPEHIGYQYLKELADLYTEETNVRWDSLDLMTIMEYPVGGLYADHTDWSLVDDGCNLTEPFDEFEGYRKISFITQLSEPDTYEGGDVRIWLDGKALILPKDRGTICAFPSFNLHAVTPITSGKRLSMVSWVLGNENWI